PQMAAASGKNRLSQRQQSESKSAYRITVTDPQLHPSNFTAYKVTMHVVPRIVIYKRFKDFQRLHRLLSDLHTKLQRRDHFPPLPEVAYFNRFEPEVIESRRKAAELALQFCADQPHLRQHSAFQAFFQSGVRTAGPPTPAQASLTSASPAPAVYEPMRPVVPEASPLSTFSSPEEEQPPPAYTRSVSGTSGHSGLPDVSEFDPFVVGGPATAAGATAAPAEAAPTADLLLTLHSDTPTELEDEMLMSRLHSLKVVSSFEDADATDGQSGVDEAAVFGLPPAPPPLSGTEQPISPLYGTSGGGGWPPTPAVPPYLAEAASHVTEAQRHESAGDFALAFAEYKAGVEVLLGGVQLDSDADRRSDVKRKTEQYLRRAEAIYDRYLDSRVPLLLRKVSEDGELVRVFHSVPSRVPAPAPCQQPELAGVLKDQLKVKPAAAQQSAALGPDSSFAISLMLSFFRDYYGSETATAATTDSSCENAGASSTSFVEIGGAPVDSSKDVDSDDGLRRSVDTANPASSLGNPQNSSQQQQQKHPGGCYRGRALSSVFAQIVDSVLQQSHRSSSSNRNCNNCQSLPTAALPESCVRQWGAELLTCFCCSAAIRGGLYFGCLLPGDVLLGDRGHLRLTYRFRRTRLAQALSGQSVGDWWSLGCHLLLMLTGDCVCRAVRPPPPLPDWLSAEARDLLSQLLCPEPRHRLGGGSPGPDEIRQHAFFRGVDWRGLGQRRFEMAAGVR
uniref:PX domain-containing protein n=1 Tax=Macrostomum lignano TaxID=282301 RepID=A0A1I8F510_9PLAT